MAILGAVIVPHPPLIIPAVGRGREQEVQATIDAYRTAAKQVAAWEPEVLIITSPHQIMYADYFHISPGRGATGDMSAFGASGTKLRLEYDAQLRDEIIRCGEPADLRVGILGQRDPYLDHGTFVPLYFLREAGVDCPILRIGLSGFSPLDHYRLGQCIAQAVETLGRRAVFIASGDLSHKLKDDGPYGFAQRGRSLTTRSPRLWQKVISSNSSPRTPPSVTGRRSAACAPSRSWPGRWTAWAWSRSCSAMRASPAWDMA